MGRKGGYATKGQSMKKKNELKYPDRKRQDKNTSTSISLEKSLFDMARNKAKTRELDFSKYVRWLIRRDLGQDV